MRRAADRFGRMAFELDIMERVKSSTSGRQYFLESPPGIGGDPRLDPVLALAVYLLVRGETDGPLFVHFEEMSKGRHQRNVTKPLTDSVFLSGLREALDEAGEDAYKFIGTHSFKRGGVQLYKQLGVPDAEIKTRGFWRTDSAYYSYLQAHNRLEKRFTYTSPLAALVDVINVGYKVDYDVIKSLIE